MVERLVVADLQGDAERATGCADYGAVPYEEALSVFVDAIEREAAPGLQYSGNRHDLGKSGGVGRSPISDTLPVLGRRGVHERPRPGLRGTGPAAHRCT